MDPSISFLDQAPIIGSGSDQVLIKDVCLGPDQLRQFLLLDGGLCHLVESLRRTL